MTPLTPGLTKNQQDLANRIFALVERLVAAYEKNAETRRLRENRKRKTETTP